MYLVDEIGQVVDEVEVGVGDLALEEAEEVAQGVDGPADGDDELHVVEGKNDGFVGAGVGVTVSGGLTTVDLEQDVEPAEHTTAEGGQSRGRVGLTSVAAGEHEDGAEQQAPEHVLRGAATAAGLANAIQDEVELNHLQGHGDGPVDVTVDDGGTVHLDPEFTHVEVVDGGDQADEGSNVDGGLEVVGDAAGLPQQEDGGGDHGDGDDPEGDSNAVILGEEAVSAGLIVQIVMGGVEHHVVSVPCGTSVIVSTCIPHHSSIGDLVVHVVVGHTGRG